MNKTAAITFSLAVHAIAFGLLVISFEQKPEPLSSPSNSEAVEAVAVDESRVQAELRRLKNNEQSQRQAEDDRQRLLQEEADKARQAKEDEARRLAELKAQREDEQRKADQQAKQLAVLKQEQERVQKEKAALEQKRAEEQQRLAEAEKKRKAEEARVAKMEAEKQLKERLAAEEKQFQDARNRNMSRLETQYQLDIANKVRRNWLRPAGGTEDFTCTVFVRQLPGGDVISVQVTKSCGNPALDRSVEAAVRKASPLPMPPDPDLFEKELNFTFKPR